MCELRRAPVRRAGLEAGMEDESGPRLRGCGAPACVRGVDGNVVPPERLQERLARGLGRAGRGRHDGPRAARTQRCSLADREQVEAAR